MRYLITGGCGFIGVNFAGKLLARGDSVILLDNLSRRGAVANLDYLIGKYKKAEFVHADIRVDFEKMCELVEVVDAVYHLAGQVAVTVSVSNPRQDFDENALGAFNILEAVRLSLKKPTLIYASTNKVYGGMEDIKIVKKGKKYLYKDLPNGISEKRTLDFHSPYGCSKGVADQYVRDYARIYGLKTVVMRQSCIYGPRQLGIEDQGWVAWFTIARMFDKQITIYGDGMQARDVLFIDDLFDAWDVARKKISRSSGQVYNVGGGPKFTMSLLELLDMLEDILGTKAKLKFSDWRPGDQPVYISDVSKINSKLGWRPKTTAKKGVNELVTWVDKNRDLVSSSLGL